MMVCPDTSELALLLPSLSSEYLTVIAWVSTLSVNVEGDATPLIGVAGLPSAVLPSKNVTTPLTLLTDATVAWRVTFDPDATLLPEELIVNAVGLIVVPPQPAKPPAIPNTRRMMES